MTSETSDDIASLVNSINAVVDGIQPTEEGEVFLLAASNRTAELCALLTLAQGKEWPFRKELAPLTKQLNEYFKAVERRLNTPLPELPAEELEAEIEAREDCSARLDAARIVGLSLLVHLTHAIAASEPKATNLKAV